MRAFVSSLITGFEPFRDAAASAARALGHNVTQAEDFTASPSSPQATCLQGVREADVMILILGPRYGARQASGRSATHEEYLEARGSTPVLVFIQVQVEFEADQAAFVNEVQKWESGNFTDSFQNESDLHDAVIGALHRFEMATEAGPLDEAEIERRAAELMPSSRTTSTTALHVAVAGGPHRSLLRPAELDSDDLKRFLLGEALTGTAAVLDTGAGTGTSIRGDRIELAQNGGMAVGGVTVSETGSVLVIQSAMDRPDWTAGIPSIIEEGITERLIRALTFTARVLEHVDPVHRLTHVAVRAGLVGGGFMPWRTRAEATASPNAASVGFQQQDLVVVGLSPAVRPRAALAHDVARLAEDLTVRLRREVQQ
jgi:hypothetical protein